jgi:hypothetical protein
LFPWHFQLAHKKHFIRWGKWVKAVSSYSFTYL